MLKFYVFIQKYPITRVTQIVGILCFITLILRNESDNEGFIL
jgi:hypothetical protein